MAHLGDTLVMNVILGGNLKILLYAEVMGIFEGRIVCTGHFSESAGTLTGCRSSWEYEKGCVCRATLTGGNAVQ